MELKDRNKKRLILIDLDGTTLQDDHRSIHPKTREALQKAIKRGHVVCICTGRTSRDAETIYQDLNLNTIMVSLDGGHISDPVHKAFKRIVLPISEDVIKSILSHPILKGKIDNGVIEYYNKSMSIDPSDPFFVIDATNFTVKGDIAKEWTGPSSNLILKLNTNKDFKNLIETLNQDFKNSIVVKSDLVYGVEKIRERPIIIINNKFVNKAFAASMVAQYYNLSLEDTIAFGDQMNDYEMIKAVGHGVVLKNGNPLLKEIAWKITDHTNEEGGLGLFLEKIINLD